MKLKELQIVLKNLENEFGDEMPVFIYFDKKRYEIEKVHEAGSGIQSSVEEIAIRVRGR